MMSSLNRTRFTEWLIRENGLGDPGLKEWIFCPGMLFHAVCKWWGDKGTRNTPHEGLDLFLYKDQQDRIVRLDEKFVKNIEEHPLINRSTLHFCAAIQNASEIKRWQRGLIMMF